MAVDWLCVGIVTAFWAVVGIALPFVVPKGPNSGWLLCYMHQMNPLIGPELHSETLLAVQYLWDQTITIDDLPTPPPTTPHPVTTAASF